MATANLTWVPFPGPNNQSQTIQYKKHSVSTWTTFQTVSASTTSASITGLIDNVIYDFRIITNCFVGGPTPGAPQELLIKYVCPNTTITSPSITSISVTVFYAANDISNIQINVDDPTSILITDHQSSTQSLPAGHGSGSYTQVFNNLQPDTAYDITITYQFPGDIVDPLICTYEQTTGEPPACTPITMTTITSTPTPM